MVAVHEGGMCCARLFFKVLLSSRYTSESIDCSPDRHIGPAVWELQPLLCVIVILNHELFSVAYTRINYQ